MLSSLFILREATATAAAVAFHRSFWLQSHKHFQDEPTFPLSVRGLDLRSVYTTHDESFSVREKYLCTLPRKINERWNKYSC